MLDQGLMDQLSEITPEERRLLEGGVVEHALYFSGDTNTIDREKLLHQGDFITIRPHTRFTEFPAHSHNYVEIMYMCQGKTVHVIGKDEITLGQGELLFLNQQVEHRVKRAEEEDVGVNFIVLPPFFDLALEMIGGDNVLGKFVLSALGKKGQALDFLHFRVAEQVTVQNLVENLLWSMVHKQPNSKKINQVTMGLLFLQLLNFVGELAPLEQGGNVLAVLREIEENYPTADLTKLAHGRHVSLSALSSCVHRATGKTFKALLKEKRLEKSAVLLRETTLSVQDILTAVGYENSSYFYRVFRQHFGITPQEFRNKQEKTNREAELENKK